MTEKVKPARFRIGSCANIRPQRFANRDPFPQLPFEHELLEPPTAYTRLWQVIVGLCVVWILGFAIWGMFK